MLRKDFEKPLWTPAVFNEYCPRNDKGTPTGLWARMPAVMIAIVNALDPLGGVREVDMPATSEHVWHAIRSARAPRLNS